MAFIEARSGIADSGAVYAGWASANFQVLMGGTDVSAHVTRNNNGGIKIEEYYGRPNAAHIQVNQVSGLAPNTPSTGQSLVILSATPNRYEFSGNILRMTAVTGGPSTKGVFWNCDAVDKTWLLARFALVTISFRGLGVNTIVGTLLANYTDGGFRVGAVDMSWGNVDIDFTLDTVDAALGRLAAAVGADIVVDADQCVSFLSGVVDGNPLSIDNTSRLTEVSRTEFQFVDDLTSTRTREYIVGEGSTTTMPITAVHATVIPVAECVIFAAGGGTAISGQNIITYTGKTIGNGPGSLTGCSGVVYDIPSGQQIQVLVQSDDTAAQTVMASKLGGGLSGIISAVLKDGTLSLSEATLRAASDLVTLSKSVFAFHYTVSDLYTHAGKQVAINLTNPITVVATLRIQSVTSTVRHHSKKAVLFRRQVVAGPYIRRLTSILKQLK